VELIKDAKDERLAHHDIRISEHQILRDSLRAMIAERDALREKYETPEPGQLIAEISCPSCGRPLRVEHGDDEGEIGVLTND
jgi:hypothetical protein